MPDSDNQLHATALLMRHHSRLYGYLRACLGNHADAEDVLQNVSMVVVRKFDQLDAAEGFLPWATEIARRQALEFRKRQARQGVVCDPSTAELLAQALHRVEAKTDLAARHDALAECLDELPVKSRELIRQRYQDPHGGVEHLAQQLGRTVSATYSMLKRIRELLRKCVEAKLAEGGT